MNDETTALRTARQPFAGTIAVLAAALLPLAAAAQPMPIGDAYYAYYFYDTVERGDGAGGLAYDEVLVDSDAQHGGALLRNHVVGSNILGVPGGGAVAAYNDGGTFWTKSVAPHIGGDNHVVGTRSQVYVAQSFRKDSVDASLSFSFSAGSLQLVDYGSGRRYAPLAASARFSAIVVEHATGLLEFEERQSVYLFKDERGFAPTWQVEVIKESGPLASGAAPWSWYCDNCGRAAYGFADAALIAPYTQQLRISGIAVGEEFTVSFFLETAAHDLLQGETAAASFAQDPLSSSGTGFSFAGLTPTNRPIISAIPEPQSWALLLAGAAFVGWHRRNGGR